MRGYSQPYGICNGEGRQLVAGLFGDVVGGAEQAYANSELIVEAVALLDALKGALGDHPLCGRKIAFCPYCGKRLTAERRVAERRRGKVGV